MKIKVMLTSRRHSDYPKGVIRYLAQKGANITNASALPQISPPTTTAVAVYLQKPREAAGVNQQPFPGSVCFTRTL